MDTIWKLSDHVNNICGLIRKLDDELYKYSFMHNFNWIHIFETGETKTREEAINKVVSLYEFWQDWHKRHDQEVNNV